MKTAIFALSVASASAAVVLSSTFAIIACGIFALLYVYIITYKYITTAQDKTSNRIAELEKQLSKQSGILNGIEYKLGMRKP